VSIDWVVGWPDTPPEFDTGFPSVSDIKEVLEDYLTDLQEEIKEHSPGFLSVKLRGNNSHMWKRHGGVIRSWDKERERWFEVSVHKTGLTVTTRLQDDVTNCLAADFARRCAQRWDGELDEPS
jgi:hypothetical protein